MEFPYEMSDDEFLRFMNDMRGTKYTSLQKQLMEKFELNPKGKIKKFLYWYYCNPFYF
jgi:ABC-2 type transport system ATP-binding protein